MSGATSSSEMLMYLKTTDGKTVKAESTVTVDGKGLLSGFQAGNFFEVENFAVGIELQDDVGGELTGDTRSFAAWRAMDKDKLAPEPPFLPDPGDLSISRKIDTSSPVLLEHCLNSKEFSEAVVVRRRLIGDGTLAVVMRISLGKVFLRSINWEDDDTVRETCKFRFSSLKLTYVQFKSGSSAGIPFNCEWSLPASSS